MGKKRKMETSFDFGWNYAKFYIESGEFDAEPVDIEREVRRSIAIPPDDYSFMRSLGIDVNEREYWEGFNAYVEAYNNKKQRRGKK